MNTTVLLGVAAVPAIAGLVEVCKDLGLPVRAAPMAAVIFGIFFAELAFWSPQLPWTPALVSGAALGLAASGLYSGASTIVQGPSGATPAHKARLKKIVGQKSRPGGISQNARTNAPTAAPPKTILVKRSTDNPSQPDSVDQPTTKNR